MKLTEKAVASISKPGTLRLELAKALRFTDDWIARLAKKNDSNGPLTTAGALRVIRKETGLTDAELLTETEPETEQAHQL